MRSRSIAPWLLMGTAIVFMIAVTIWMVTACSAPESGYVTKKNYQGAWDQVTIQCMSHDPKTYACTFSMPVTHHWPEEFYLCLRNDDKPQDIKTGCRQVPESEYNRYNVGDHYPNAR